MTPTIEEQLDALLSWAAAAQGEPDLLLSSWRDAERRAEVAEAALELLHGPLSVASLTARADAAEAKLSELPSKQLWDESRKALASMRNDCDEQRRRADWAELRVAELEAPIPSEKDLQSGVQAKFQRLVALLLRQSRG